MKIQILKKGIKVPEYKSFGAVGLDLQAALDSSVVLFPGNSIVIPSGIMIQLPVGFEGQIRPRSGLAIKHGITVVNSPGTIDYDYRGELLIGLINLGKNPYTINKFERVAQLVISPIQRVELEVTTVLDKTERGAKGLGSSGRM